MSIAFGIIIETDQLATDSLYPYSSRFQSPTNEYSQESEFLSLLESKVEGPADISLRSDGAIGAMDVETTAAEFTARESMARDVMEADGGELAEEMRRNDSGRTGLGRTDAGGAANLEDRGNSQSDLRSSGAEIGSSAAKKAVTGDRIALSSKALGAALQRSSETANKGDVGDDHNTALQASISDDLRSLSSSGLDQLAGASLGGNGRNLGGNAENESIPASLGLSERHLKSAAQKILNEVAGGAEGLNASVRGHNVSGSAKLVVLDLRSNREVDKSERDSKRRAPAGSRLKSRASLLGSRASLLRSRASLLGSRASLLGSRAFLSDLQLEARRSAGIGDTRDLQKSEEPDSNGAQTPLLARVANQELKQGFRSQRLGGAPFERFKEALRNEVVRSTSIMLKDKGQGELRLILKPESLGNVRIWLTLNNNHIEGRIIVENNTVKEMFESNLQNLNNAFQKEGFSSSSLEVFVSGGNGQRRQREMQAPSFSAVQEFENTIPIQDEYISEDWLINIIV